MYRLTLLSLLLAAVACQPQGHTPPAADSVEDSGASAPVDTDGDGIDDETENLLGTDPAATDSDGDGLNDGYERAATGTDPLRADTDADTLFDGDELHVYGSDPLVADTDGDKLYDGDEVERGTDPKVVDSDGDGLTDGDEVMAGVDPLLVDTDADGYSDWTELNADAEADDADSRPSKAGPDEWAPCVWTRAGRGKHLPENAYPEGTYGSEGGPECACQFEVIAQGPVQVNGISVLGTAWNQTGTGWELSGTPDRVSAAVPWAAEVGAEAEVSGNGNTADLPGPTGTVESMWYAYQADPALRDDGAFGLFSEGEIAVEGQYTVYLSMINDAGEVRTDCHGLLVDPASPDQGAWLRVDTVEAAQ